MSYEMKSAHNNQSLSAQHVPATAHATARKLKLRTPALNNETQALKSVIQTEAYVEEHAKSIAAAMTKVEQKILGHLGEYVEEPYQIIESYFEGKHLDRLVRHQIESYNNFVNYQIQRTIDMFNPVKIHSDLSLIHI